ncbi:MAG: transposase [Thioalkalivibrio sp.]|nr:transposase [Thioalkalivibrio sp.]
MPKAHPLYPAEYRNRILKLGRAGRSPEALAEEFVPTAQTLRNWVVQVQRDTSLLPNHHHLEGTRAPSRPEPGIGCRSIGAVLAFSYDFCGGTL